MLKSTDAPEVAKPTFRFNTSELLPPRAASSTTIVVVAVPAAVNSTVPPLSRLSIVVALVTPTVLTVLILSRLFRLIVTAAVVLSDNTSKLAISALKAVLADKLLFAAKAAVKLNTSPVPPPASTVPPVPPAPAITTTSLPSPVVIAFVQVVGTEIVSTPEPPA